jgi:hypothetical protein
MYMVQKPRRLPAGLFISILVMFSGLSPVPVTPVRLTSGGLLPAAWQDAQPISAGIMNTPGTLIVKHGLARIESPSGNWQSPESWTVQQAAWTDLNHDGVSEVTLQVKRPFAPWPVDRVLPYGGFIASHQDDRGQSSHIILIGWKKDHWGELWAGSALARPVLSFQTVDVDQDGRQELVVLEGNYASQDPGAASSLAVWKWNTFGFDLVARLKSSSRQFLPVVTKSHTTLILMQ